METKKLFGIVLFILVAFSIASCNDEDEVDISQLAGTWHVTNDDPNLIVEGFVTYTFNTDNSCNIYSYDALSNIDTTVNRSYVISNDHSLITLFNEENRYTEQYLIRKLTPNEMKWENASPKDGNSDKRLIKE